MADDDDENWRKIQQVVEAYQNKVTETTIALAEGIQLLTAGFDNLRQRIEALEARANKRGEVVSLKRSED